MNYLFLFFFKYCTNSNHSLYEILGTVIWICANCLLPETVQGQTWFVTNFVLIVNTLRRGMYWCGSLPWNLRFHNSLNFLVAKGADSFWGSRLLYSVKNFYQPMLKRKQHQKLTFSDRFQINVCLRIQTQTFKCPILPNWQITSFTIIRQNVDMVKMRQKECFYAQKQMYATFSNNKRSLEYLRHLKLDFYGNETVFFV